MQLLDEFLAVAQAIPVLVVDISDDEELAGGLSPTIAVCFSLSMSVSQQKRGRKCRRSLTSNKDYKRNVRLVVSI